MCDETRILFSFPQQRAKKVEAPSRRLRSGETPLPPSGYQGRSPWLVSFCRETGRLQENSPPRLRGCGEQRHWGGASRCDPATYLGFSSTVRTTPAVACGRGLPLL